MNCMDELTGIQLFFQTIPQPKNSTLPSRTPKVAVGRCMAYSLFTLRIRGSVSVTPFGKGFDSLEKSL